MKTHRNLLGVAGLLLAGSLLVYCGSDDEAPVYTGTGGTGGTSTGGTGGTSTGGTGGTSTGGTGGTSTGGTGGTSTGGTAGAGGDAGSAGAAGSAAAGGSAGAAGSAAAGGSAGAAGSAAAGGSAGAAGSAAAGGSAGAAGSAAAGGSAGAGGSGGAPMVPSINGWQFWVDCMPIVGPDPINGFYTGSYDNTSGTSPATATVVQSRLVFSTGEAWTFDVDPASSGSVPAGSGLSVMHDKVAASGTGSFAPCTQCNGTWTLEVTWNVAGARVVDTSGPQNVACAY